MNTKIIKLKDLTADSLLELIKNKESFSIIEIDYDFKDQPAHFVGLGTNLSQTKLYLGVYGHTKELNKGSIFEIIPYHSY